MHFEDNILKNQSSNIIDNFAVLDGKYDASKYPMGDILFFQNYFWN